MAHTIGKHSMLRLYTKSKAIDYMLLLYMYNESKVISLSFANPNILHD